MNIGTKVRIRDTQKLPPFQRYTLSNGIKEWFVGGFIEGWEGSPGTVYLCEKEIDAILCGSGNTRADVIIDDTFVEVVS